VPIDGYTCLILYATNMTACVKAQKLLDTVRWALQEVTAGNHAAPLGCVVLPDVDREQVITKRRSNTVSPW
jgi:hypothetical protein